MFFIIIIHQLASICSNGEAPVISRVSLTAFHCTDLTLQIDTVISICHGIRAPLVHKFACVVRLLFVDCVVNVSGVV